MLPTTFFFVSSLFSLSLASTLNCTVIQPVPCGNFCMAVTQVCCGKGEGSCPIGWNCQQDDTGAWGCCREDTTEPGKKCTGIIPLPSPGVDFFPANLMGPPEPPAGNTTFTSPDALGSPTPTSSNSSGNFNLSVTVINTTVQSPASLAGAVASETSDTKANGAVTFDFQAVLTRSFLFAGFLCLML